MGHYIKNIIKQGEDLMPSTFSLAGNPNFAQFVSLHGNDGQSGKINVGLTLLDSTVSLSKTKIEIVESLTATVHTIEGTRNKEYVGNMTFFVADDLSVTTENIRACLMKIPFLKNNFEITIPLEKNEDIVIPGKTIQMVSRGGGQQYAFSFSNMDSNFLKIEGDPSVATSDNSISGDKNSCEIEIDVYHDTGLFPGEKDDLTLGTFVTALSKAYFGNPLWFDVNVIANDRKGYSTRFLDSKNWCDAGTASDYRFVAKRFDGVNHEVFYVSDVYYAVNGYGRVLEKNNLEDYVYRTNDGNLIRPLTNQPSLTHIEGQSQYFNFIISNPDKNKPSRVGDKIGIRYEVYSQSGNHITNVTRNEIAVSDLAIVNTIRLEIDEVVQKYSNAGMIKTYLTHNNKEVSKPLTFNLLPSCLYELNEFAFLNSLGGWSSFNFGGVRQVEFKTKSNTIFKTHMPSFGIASDIESVIKKEVEEQFVVETIPVDATVADWLKELSGSVAVFKLESSKNRYIVVDDLDVKHNSKDDLFTLQMKYHYSDAYNGVGR